RNPLVEPGLIGVSSGAAVGAAAVIVLGGAMLWLPLAAFSGAMLVTLSVMLVARVHGQESTSTLLLAGVAVNALAAAILGVLTVAADDPALRTLTFWMFGSLARSGQAELLILALLIVPGTVMMWRYAGFLDAMALGEGGAAHLGYAVRRDRWILVALVALAVGVAVAFSGIIGFVGLVVPHLARLLFGAAHRQLLPISAALGAILLMLVDTISRLVLMPAEVPVGVITALVGAPLFIGLLIWRARMSEAFA
ncbi:MAG: iron ABC transporter permease, partial [Oceanococcaceae bacterium]